MRKRNLFWVIPVVVVVIIMVTEKSSYIRHSAARLTYVEMLSDDEFGPFPEEDVDWQATLHTIVLGNGLYLQNMTARLAFFIIKTALDGESVGYWLNEYRQNFNAPPGLLLPIGYDTTYVCSGMQWQYIQDNFDICPDRPAGESILDYVDFIKGDAAHDGHGLLLWDGSPIRLVYGVKYSVNSESLEVYELGVHSFIDCQLVPKQPAELFQIFNDDCTFVIQFL